MIALVLVTYNRSVLLKQMLVSVNRLNVKPQCVFIIDNNSNDDTRDVINEFINYKDEFAVIYHNTGSNLGGAGGFEQGSRLAYDAGYEWIWLADDDVVLEPDCLKQLLIHKNEADILQPLRMNLDGTCAEISGIDYQIDNIFRLNPKRRRVVDIFDEDWVTHPVKTIPFEGPLINRRVFEKIGFPDGKFFIFYDDLDFAIRAERNNFKLICVKYARILRKIPFIQSLALSSWKGYFMYRNFFKVQLTYGNKIVSLTRVSFIITLVAVHSIFTGRAKSIFMLLDAFKDALKKDFPTNPKYKP